MGAVPKRRISSGRKGRRRAHNALKKPTLSTCPKCGKAKRPHFECSFCGHYGPKVEVKVAAKRAKTSKETK